MIKDINIICSIYKKFYKRYNTGEFNIGNKYMIDNDRLKHSISVARKMVEIGKE